MAGSLIRLDLLQRLQHVQTRLSRSESLVADVVLFDPGRIPRMNLSALAEQAKVSEPTVLRFCRSLGLDGYTHFKISLAQALAAGGASYLHREISFEDSPDHVCDKLFESTFSVLGSVRQSLDRRALFQAAERVGAARRLELFGVGLANSVASDAAQKFMRLDVICSALHDTHLQTMAAATLQKDDVAIAFSYNGRIKDILRAATTARQNGAFTIAVTPGDSALAKAVDLVLNVDTPEDTFVYAPMTTRLAHLVVVDLIVTLVARAKGPEVTKRFEHIKQSLSDQWIADDEMGGGGTGRRSRKTHNHSER